MNIKVNICLLFLGIVLTMLKTDPIFGAKSKDQTMLLFVGEDLELLSIASRREESASQAPAIADVITRKEIKEQGLTTLSEALERLPGFYMAEKKWGSMPYMRGMRNSVLFLYDTVPLMADTSKNLHQMDYELSLAGVKKIEVIRGPASVLWGPDAFGGVVNVVPLSARDVEGIETGVSGIFPEDSGNVYLNAGKDYGVWDGIISMSARLKDSGDKDWAFKRFWGSGEKPVNRDLRFGAQTLDDAYFLDFFTKANFRDWLSVSGRFSDNYNPYFITSQDVDDYWQEARDFPMGHLKLEADKKIDQDSALRIASYFSYLNPEYEVIDYDYNTIERTYYAEMIYDRSFWLNQGLFTGGISYRKKDISNAHIWESYIPGYLEGIENETVLPLDEFSDYSTELCSLFGQYRHKFSDLEFIFGLRGGFHEDYKDQLSLSTGVVWQALEEMQLKLLYANAYRTPFSQQLQEEEEPELEKIQTVTAQINVSPHKNFELSLTGFFSQVEDHVMDDLYAGMSKENTQDFYGTEISVNWALIPELVLSSNLSLLENSGPDEKFEFVEYSQYTPDGTWETVSKTYSNPFDVGAKEMGNFMLDWQPCKWMHTNLHLKYIGSRELIVPGTDKTEEAESAWILNAAALIEDFALQGLDLSVKVENMLDNEYESPGTYTMIKGKPLSAEIKLSYSW